jgi:hypothetical protein
MSLIELANFAFLLICGFFAGRYFWFEYGVWFGIGGFIAGIAFGFCFLNALGWILSFFRKVFIKKS